MVGGYPMRSGRKCSLLFPRASRPRLGATIPPLPARKAMDGIFFVLRTGCQWGALDSAGICKHSSAHRHFQHWVREGLFAQPWLCGLLCCEQLHKIDWSWLAMDGALTKSPLGGEKNRPQFNRSGQARRQAGGRDRFPRHSLGSVRGRGQLQRL
ncbi:MAG: transposase [Verrucomicrobiales bacterium]|nr:transposase [Verrucomicrobiales bacterium]